MDQSQSHRRKRGQPRIDDRETTTTSRTVKIEAQAHPDPQKVEHLLVEDVIAFARALELAEAPIHEGVAFIPTRGSDSGLALTMICSWQARQELINGEPAHQAVKEDPS